MKDESLNDLITDSNKINIIGDYKVNRFSNNRYHPLCIDCNRLYLVTNNNICIDLFTEQFIHYQAHQQDNVKMGSFLSILNYLFTLFT